MVRHLRISKKKDGMNEALDKALVPGSANSL